MPFICYEDKNFAPKTRVMINQAAQICREYTAAGYDLTLRQLYYQFVSRGLIDNKQTEYKRLGSVVNDGRLAGLLDWDWINDRTRNAVGRYGWESPHEIIRNVSRSFHIDYWADQPIHVEVWVEKEALAGVVEQTTWGFDVTSLACRGYMSQSEQWSAGQRFVSHIEDGKQVVILHLGDHDPSGMDMTRDNRERLEGFIREHCGWEAASDMFRVKRIALNRDQIQRYNPPPNPAKVTDSRFDAYEAEFGDESWELDALPPDVLATLITEEIQALMDPTLFAVAIAREAEMRRRIVRLVDEHGDILNVAR